jgi:hypothetical protein
MAGMAELPPDVADQLYSLPPSEFVAARGALARELRAGGDKATAALVAKLRRPTPVAGALNRLVREQPGVVEAAVAAGTALQAATDAALGGDASALRAATADDRAATKALSEAVAELLDAAPTEVAQRVTATIRAAVASPDVAATLDAGRLDADHEPTGFGLPDGAEPAGAPVDELAPRRRARADKAEREQAERDAEERRARTRRRAAHEQKVARLQAKAERLATVAREAEQAATDARAAADASDEELEAARAEDPEAEAD